MTDEILLDSYNKEINIVLKPDFSENLVRAIKESGDN